MQRKAKRVRAWKVKAGGVTRRAAPPLRAAVASVENRESQQKKTKQKAETRGVWSRNRRGRPLDKGGRTADALEKGAERTKELQARPT